MNLNVEKLNIVHGKVQTNLKPAIHIKITLKI